MQDRILVVVVTLLSALASTSMATEVLLPGELVETVDADTLLVACQGVGAGVEEAVLHARQGCLRWYAESLADGPAEEAALQKLWPALVRELDRFVGPARAGGRDARGEGLRSRRTEDDGRVMVRLNTRLSASALKARMMEAGALKPLPAAGTGRSVVVVPAPGQARPKLWFLVKAELIPFLQHARLEVLDEPEEGAPPGAELVLRASVKRLEENRGMQVVSYAVSLELVEVASKRVVATGSVQGAQRPAGLDAEEARGLREAVVGAAGALQPRLEAYARGGGGR
jgi:hypothetical protein